MEIKRSWRTLRRQKEQEFDCKEVKPIFRMSSLPFLTTTLFRPINGFKFCRFVILGVIWWVALESMYHETSPSIDRVSKLVK